MTSIRALVPADLERAVAVFDARLGSGRGRAEPAVVAFFSRTVFEDPWADPELPSLVAEDDDGRIVGFMTISARRMRLASRPVRLAVCANLCVTPEAERRATGIRLMQRALQGPQDMAVSDSASDGARRMWMRLGGTTLPVSAIEWVRVFAPWRTGAQRAEARLSRPRARRALGCAAAALDRATVIAAPGLLVAPPSATGGEEPLTPRALVEALPAVADRVALRPDYDEAYAAWLLGELARVPARGELVARLVRRSGSPSGGPGRIAGWYVYHLHAGRRCDVLTVAAPNESDVELVVDHLFAHAQRHGAAALRGRLEPRLVNAVTRRRCLLRHGGPALLHTHDGELARAVLAGDALLTRLEGEWAASPVGSAAVGEGRMVASGALGDG
ncbi:MAG: hypothetical protein WKF94_19725 [Solirubrobacteraceae bacterium]